MDQASITRGFVAFLAVACLLQAQHAQGQIELQIGICVSDTCLNGGECIQFFRTIYYCNCMDGFSGATCEDATPCSSSPCENGGTCTTSEDGESATCECTENFIGAYCQSAAPCYSSPCENGGTCYTSEDGESVTCECPDNYMGAYCQFGAINAPGVCGINPAAQLSPRFFGGDEATSGTWPWQGYIQFSRGPAFGVTLISDQWAVTSWGNIEVLATPTSLDYVVFGDTFQGAGDEASENRQVAYVDRAYPFPGANFFTFEGDVMLLKFVEPLTITDYVRPICLPSEDVNEVTDYDVCYTTGWGLNEDNEFNTYLQEEKAAVLDYYNCSSKIKDLDGIFLASENMICASYDEDLVGPCLGDGGNPIACYGNGTWDVVGIISWGYGCGSADSPSIAWRTTAYLDFINDVITHTYDAKLCEPVEEGMCADYLPYNATYRGTQQTAEYTVSRLFEIGSQAPYCNTSDLLTTLCAASHGDCYPGEEGQKVLCRGYCEAVIGYCNLTDSVICTDLPYGYYGQKWCVKGADYSCGYYNRTLTLEEPLLHLGSPLAPYAYTELRRCFWLLSAPEGYVIQLKYNYLSVYPDADYISYGEGDPYSYTSTLARFDGDVPPGIWTSSYNSMWIKFQSQIGPGSGYGFGLYAFITPEEGRECLDTDIFCDDTCYDYSIACDFIYDCYDGTDEAYCGDLEVGEDGLNITSPFYPIVGYPENFTFTWNLNATDGYQIALYFSSLSIDEYGDDALYIGEGSDGGIEDALYVFTGYQSSFRILPFADSIWMTLVSDDDDGGGRGFGALAYLVNDTAAAELECDEDYEFDCGDGVCLSYYVTCDGTEQCQDGSDEAGCARDACNDGTYLPPYETCNQEWFCQEGEDEEDCPPLENGEAFYLGPPHDPYDYDRYANNLSFSWTAKAGEGSGFAVEFVFFTTEPRFDRLYIGSPSSSLDDLYYFEGYGSQKPFVLESDEFYAQFVSDENKNDGTVYVLVTVVDLEESVTCDKGTLLHPNQVCNGLWECLDGRDESYCEPLERNAVVGITTPYFPESYENNADLLWTFTAEDDLQILFLPQLFYTEEDYDILRIGSGTECREAYFEELSGVIGNGEAFISQDNTLCLHFSSDYTYTDVGFHGYVLVVSEEDYVVCPEDETIVAQFYICDREWNCGQTGLDEVDCERFQLGDAVYLNSPYYPDVYPANNTWTWSGSGEEGLAAYIEFYEFDVEEYVDFLYIGCGLDPSDEDSIRAVLTGSEIPDPILLNCSDVWLRLESDGEGQNYGYSGLLTIVDPVDECAVPPEVYPENACASIKLCEVEGEFICVPLSYEPYPVVTTNYPYPYDDNTTATALLIAPEGYRIVLNISDFALEDGFDFLGVGFEPNPTSEDYASVLTGNDLDLPYTTVTPGRTLSLKFTSDDGVVDTGFYGQAYIIPEEAVLFCDGYEVEPEKICNYIWDCSDGSDEAYCDPVPAGGSDITASPGYPEEDYPNNATIVWSFTGEPASRFTVKVIDLETEEDYDFLNIGYGRDPYDASTLLASFSGSELPEEAVVTPGNLLWVSLVTDEAFNFRGFLLNISLQASERGCNVSEDLPAQSVCGALLFCEINQTIECNDVSEEPQSVSSPNFPDVYDDSSEIRSVFVAPDGYRLVLNITEFALEEEFDFLYVGNEVDLTSTDFERSLTGNSLDLPYVFMSEGNTLVTLFYTDDAIGDSGYYGNVYAISEEEIFVCDGQTIAPEDLCNYEWHCRDGSDEEDCEDPVAIGKRGYVASPDYPDDYPNNEYITWTFVSEPGSLFSVNVFDLALEDGFDFLRFGSGRDPNNTATELAALTGSELPDEQFVTRGNELWVTFVTDDAFNERGFFINLTIVEDMGRNCSDGSAISSAQLCNYILDCPYGEDEEGCGLLGEGDYTLIYSPDYPDYYPNDVNVTYLVGAEDGLVLFVNFTDFLTEFSADTVTVGNGDDPYDAGSEIATVSGFILPGDIISNSSVIWIRFSTDPSVNLTGFLAHITAVNPEEFDTCYNGDLIPPSEICNYEWFCENGVDELGYDVICPTLGLDSRRIFSSPNYPYPFPSYTNVTWTFAADPGLFINLTISNFDAPNGNLSIGYGRYPSNSSTLLATLSGYVDEETQVSIPSNETWIRLEAPEAGLGFYAELSTYLGASSVEYEPIPEPCQTYLPYTQASLDTMFPLRFNLGSRDLQLPLFFAPGTCDDESLRRAVCRILYPPAVMPAVPSGPCVGACQRFSSCPNALLLLEVDCDALDFTVMGSLPGLCTRA